jgi:glycosyltransferase involved in cell wall biosynthesis
LKKVLIITYYWPPSGGSPVLRWLKFVKYLPEFGWQPIVFTPQNPVPQAYDETLLGEVPSGIRVYKHKIIEPANSFGFKKPGNVQAASFISEKKKKSLFQELMIWIRGNFFIPDARMLWIRPAVRKIIQILKDEPVDAIISTGPPHSMHLIAYHVKKKIHIPWIADFRDPWTKIDYYKELKLTRAADSRHHKLEKLVLSGADKVITVGSTMTREFMELGYNHITTLTNGYDDEAIPDEPTRQTGSFTILHVGSMPESRNPAQLWPVLRELCTENKDFSNKLKIKLIGKVDHTILADIENNNLGTYLERKEQVSNSEALREMKQATVLLLVINNTHNSKGILTNKFFEYLSVGRPILAIGPEDGDVAQIIRETGAGSIFDYDVFENLKNKMGQYYMGFCTKPLSVSPAGIEQYSRRNLTKELAGALNNLFIEERG